MELARIRDQIDLEAGDATEEEILTRQRELQSDFEYNVRVGFSYTFGSIFSNVVNPRFGGSTRFFIREFWPAAGRRPRAADGPLLGCRQFARGRLRGQTLGTANKITPELQEYILRVGVREHPVLERCREETRRDLPDRVEMQIAPEQGAFLALLVRLLGARRALEVGVFTGYSGLAVALALPSDGQLVACEMDRDFARRARRYWEDAGVVDRVDLRLGPGLETLESLIEEGAAGTFDLAFIDADKTGYDDYYELCLTLLRSGGVVAFDNTLWGGSVLDASDRSADTLAIRALNEKLARDERVDLALTTIGDGLTLALKR